MPPHPEPVLTAGGVRAMDADLDRAGLLDLAMEHAGRAVADHARAHFPGARVLLLAGSGANGGDALVAARHLHALGEDARVLALPARHPLTRANRRRLTALGVPTARLSAPALAGALRRADLIIDGLLGTGFVPPLQPALAALTARVNASGLPVLSIDVPTGVNADTAEADDDALRATYTVVLAGLKPTLLFGPAAHHAGTLLHGDLRVPPAFAARHAVATREDDAALAARLPVRFADAHKGTAGRVWVVGGHPGTTGAPLIAGVGALRAGAGLITVHSEADLPLLTPELMLRRHADLTRDLQDQAKPDAVVLGMGLGSRALTVARAALAWDVPTVLDADALQPELTGVTHARTVLTPHPGEAARLLGTDTPAITRDPLGAARALQERYACTVLLKGGPSVVAGPDGLTVVRGGHPGMASGGMGDLLGGVIAALLGQGLSAPDATRAGARLHARAGERAAVTHGYGLSATDVAAELGGAWADLMTARPAEFPVG
ncbi:bifunctional ADP-dependent NAD(P)H-hydrate dehydratase/NAD(P)H-hydrate epimerase [Deinococcus maricopensis]|uniref:Bifunctional NAD(P)H-hydrate repair enzyme n=1 Tax=Deinococcus maricopensis (strain DSM 21211 / LMG 22137 / NRRL B-23946 / LB-34) TaxID=709986 RepID=E8UBA5_DEIML|nr:bifunctional ADP-dependent NAD(P)H-hydrate dehydratase/NAD(P)H-hydrate epimerase [Deinococcus maricopensis]ADV68344.1 YjeF-related protein [Deinococcus maricopensis DSM 21211]